MKGRVVELRPGTWAIECPDCPGGYYSTVDGYVVTRGSADDADAARVRHDYAEHDPYAARTRPDDLPWYREPGRR